MWCARLGGDERCLEDMKDRFRFCIKFRDGNYFMEHPYFISLKTDNDVIRCAEKHLKTLLGILKVSGIHCKVNIVGVTGTDEKGIKHGTVDVPCTINIRNPIKELSQKEFDKWYKCAESNENVAMAFRYYNKINDETIFFNAWNIFELIRKDLKDNKKLRNIFNISDKKLSDFRETINYLSGEKSRHPPNIDRQHLAIHSDEIKDIITIGLKNWINSKC